MLIIIHVFYCICAFCWFIEDIITVQKIHGMESFKIVPCFGRRIVCREIIVGCCDNDKGNAYIEFCSETFGAPGLNSTVDTIY